jgi:hypothetical protein
VPKEELSLVMRRAFQERIEENQDMLRRFRVGSGPTRIPIAEPDEGVELPSIVADLSTIRTASDVHAPEPRRGRRLLIPSVAVLVAAGIALVLLLPRKQDEPVPAVAAAPATSSPTPSGAPPPAPERDVLVRIETAPPGARVLLA